MRSPKDMRTEHRACLFLEHYFGMRLKMRQGNSDWRGEDLGQRREGYAIWRMAKSRAPRDKGRPTAEQWSEMCEFWRGTKRKKER